MSAERSSYDDAMVTCRAPRAAISFDASADWESRTAIVIAAMGKYWGGSQFILVPHLGGEVDPSLLRAATIHDPDHVFEYNFSDEELERCAGTFVSSNEVVCPAMVQMQRAWPSRPPTSLLDAVSIYRMEMIENRPPSGSVFMSADGMGTITMLEHMPGGHDRGVYQAVPEQCGGSIGLAMALRAGFVEPPRLPFRMDPNFDLSPEDFGYALGRSRPTNAILTSTGGLAVGNPTPDEVPVSWTRTQPGIGRIDFVPDILRPSIAVIGSTVQDFCLAFALDRMTGFVQWFPGDLLAADQHADGISMCIFDFLNNTYQRSAESRITSISWTEQSLSELVKQRFEPNFVAAGEPVQIPYIAPTDVAVGQPGLLACMPNDFGIHITLPIIEDESGGIELAQSIPAIVVLRT